MNWLASYCANHIPTPYEYGGNPPQLPPLPFDLMTDEYMAEQFAKRNRTDEQIIGSADLLIRMVKENHGIEEEAEPVSDWQGEPREGAPH